MLISSERCTFNATWTKSQKKKKKFIFLTIVSKLIWNGMGWKGRGIWKWVYKWKMKNNMFEALKTIWNNKYRDNQNYYGILLYQISRLIKNLYELKQMWQNEKIKNWLMGKNRVQKQACICENLLIWLKVCSSQGDKMRLFNKKCWGNWLSIGKITNMRTYFTLKQE